MQTGEVPKRPRVLWLCESQDKQLGTGLNTAWEEQQGWPGFPPSKSGTAKPESHKTDVPQKVKGKRELKAQQPSACHTNSSCFCAGFARNQWGEGVHGVHSWRFGCTWRDCKILAQEPGRESQVLKGFLVLHSSIKAADRDNAFHPDTCLQTDNLVLCIYLYWLHHSNTQQLSLMSLAHFGSAWS